jgi:hypothetical protein
LTDVAQYSWTSATPGDVALLSGTTEVTPTPAPAGSVLLLSGAPLLLLGSWFRRRQVAKA